MFTTVDEETGVRSFRDPTSEGFTEATRLSERGAKGFDELTVLNHNSSTVIIFGILFKSRKIVHP